VATINGWVDARKRHRAMQVTVI